MNKKAYNQANCIISSICALTLIISFSLFLTFILLLTTSPQFIAFNEFSATGAFPALYFYIAIALVIVYAAVTVASVFGVWASIDVVNRWCARVKWILSVYALTVVISGLLQLAAGIATLVYMTQMPGPIRQYMADNLRSNYSGGLGVNYLERQFDIYVDWTQINYQCCGVISYEDYRNGYYYNSFNKYTIVSIVPNSCCVYRDQASQLVQCQMKSVNIYRKGCYDILMYWMETFGIVIASVTLAAGLLYLLFVLVFGRICRQIERLRFYLAQASLKQNKERLGLAQNKRNAYTRNSSTNVTAPRGVGGSHNDSTFDTHTLEENVSYIESKT